MSSTLAAKAGSLDFLKVRMRCASQIRCTARKETPTARATARPVQWSANGAHFSLPGSTPSQRLSDSVATAGNWLLMAGIKLLL
jgi:hypothetical protein